ncbi:MAG: hypothetical protein IT327_14765 [Anaerolineae bacterium]|nr:hypothetical protein [Anaerolineae bacterium]
MLKNGSFTEGWTNLPPYGTLINQQPNGWTLRCINPGESLFGAGDAAGGVPECVHKLADQLPPNERLGGKDALILAGDTTYKVFHAGSSFGVELKQVVTGLKPGSEATLVVPVLAVLYDDPDPYGAESGVWVNGEGEWANGGKMGSRKWYRHMLTFSVPGNGTAVIEIRLKSKWARKKDFFIDGITLEAEAAADNIVPIILPDPIVIPDDNKMPATAVSIKLPPGMKLVTAVSNEPNTIILVVPPGTTVETA